MYIWVMSYYNKRNSKGLSIHKNLRNSSIFNIFKIVNSASTNFDRNGVRIKLFFFQIHTFHALMIDK